MLYGDEKILLMPLRLVIINQNITTAGMGVVLDCDV